MGFWNTLFSVQTTTRTRIVRDESPMRQAIDRHATARAIETLGLPSRSRESRERIQAEIMMVAPRFAKHQGINVEERNFDWMMIPKFPLPDRFSARWCKLLIIFPETYPLSPPIGFYLNHKFLLSDGSRDGHLIGTGLHDAPDLREHGWYWYCVQLLQKSEGGWRPSASHDKPDNLHTFLSTAREILSNE